MVIKMPYNPSKKKKKKETTIIPFLSILVIKGSEGFIYRTLS